jgi:hypothetical protein
MLSKRNIRQKVVDSGLSATVIAYHAQISNSYLNTLQWGARKENPSTAVLIRLAKVLQCRVGDFFDDDAEGAA